MNWQLKFSQLLNIFHLSTFSIKMKDCLLFMLLLVSGTAFSQLVTFSGTGNLLVPPGAPAQTVGITQSPSLVSGIGIIGGCVSIDNVQFNMLHTFTGDVGILLIGPGGQVLELSTGNGGSSNNYDNTVFSDNAGIFITMGASPYSGTFKPEGRVINLNNPYSNAPALGTYTFANTYNGTNANGVWTLYINDFVAIDVGELLSWSITFNVGGTPPVANAGPDVAACPNQNTTLTATGGGNYQWSNGASTASISVAPLATTIYTVTVTTPGCGTATDNVAVTVTPRPAITLSAVNPDLCQGECQQVTATFTGTPPFNLTYRTIASNGVQTVFTQTFTSLSATFLVCPPNGSPPGNLTVQATILTDAFCTCQ